MRCVPLCASIFLLLCRTVAAADEEQAHRRVVAALDEFQDCLSDEYVQVTRSEKMTEQEFVVYIGGACVPFREIYRTTMRQFLAIQFPMMKPSLHVDSAADAVEQAQKGVIRAYVRGTLHRD